MTQPRIVIVGGGFGGLAAAKALKNSPAEIILIDRTNHHLFQPCTAFSVRLEGVQFRAFGFRNKNRRVVLLYGAYGRM